MVTLVVYNAQELCQSVHISEPCLVEIVENGIVSPRGESLSDWIFDIESFTLVKRAVRLQRDLELDWGATALAVSLLSEIDRLQGENEYLKQRLKRFELSHIKLL